MSRVANFQSLSILVFLGCVGAAALFAVSGVLGLASMSDRTVWLASCAAIAALTALSLALLHAPKAAWLAGLLVWSGACQLWLSDGSWFKTFQVADLGRIAALAYASIVLQALVSLIVLVLDSGGWLPRTIRSLTVMRTLRLGLLFGLLALFSVSVSSFVRSYDEIGYLIQLIVGTAMIGSTMLGVAAILFASDLGDVSFSETFIARLDRHAFALLPLLFFAIAILYLVFAFGLAPVVEDETVYLFQAQTIAGGDLRASSLPDPMSSQMDFYLIENDASGWYATTVAGWPVVLSLGVLLGLPWLVNPVLGTLSVVLGMAFWRRVAGRQQAIVVGVLMIASPWLLQISASWMTHALVLALTLGSWNLIALVVGRSEYRLIPDTSVLFIAGLLMGWIFFTRALEGVIIGGLTGFALLWLFGRRRQIAPIIAYGLGCLATGSLYFLYNYHLTGDILTTPLMNYVDAYWGEGANAFGFGPGIGPPEGWGGLDVWPGHSPGEAIINLNNSLSSLNIDLFGWSMGSLILLLVCLFYRRMTVIEAAMAVLAVAVIGIHFFYWFSGTFYIGPRYWFGAFFAFIVLSAGGLDKIRQMFGQGEHGQIDRRLTILLFVFCGFSITVFSTWRAVERYAPRTQSARIMASYVLPSDSPQNAVVALPCQRLFDGAMHLNDPYLRPEAPIFAFAANEEKMDELRKAFPERELVFAGELREHCRR